MNGFTSWVLYFCSNKSTKGRRYILHSLIPELGGGVGVGDSDQEWEQEEERNANLG